MIFSVFPNGDNFSEDFRPINYGMLSFGTIKDINVFRILFPPPKPVEA